MDTYKTDILYADPLWKSHKGGRRKLYPKQEKATRLAIRETAGTVGGMGYSLQ